MDEAAFRDDFFNYLEYVEEIGDYEEVRVERLPKRYIRDSENPLEFFEENEFRRRYRFTKEATVHILLPLIDAGLRKPNNRGLPFSPMLQLLICLRYYATCSFQTVCGDLRGATQPSVSNIIQRCSILLAEKCREYVKFPEDNIGQRSNINKFYNNTNFPTVSGCIDCTHIKICSQEGDDAEVYRNRKGYFSLNVQVVAGPSMEMLDIVVRHPGSNHDSVIFDRSSVRVRFERGNLIGVLIGDSGYPCRSYLLTPVLRPGNEQEVRYNTAHIRTRNIVERVFGVWKRKFPCLQKGLTTKLETSVAIICATATLYNISIAHNLIEEDERHVELGIQNIVEENVPVNNIGLAFRHEFITRHF